MSSGQEQITGNAISHSNNTVSPAAEPDAEEHRILGWLSPLEPQERHQSVRNNRLDGVGNWVLKTKEFRKWNDTEGGCVTPVLFCSGNLGVGKTFLNSLVIDSLCDQAGGKDIAVVGLYCDYLAQQEQSTTDMLRAILKQLVSGGGIPGHIWEAFRKAEKEFGGRGLRLPDLVEILKKTISSIQRVFICIDALDESPPKTRWELLQSLREVIQVLPNTRIFLTGRSHISDEIVKHFSGVVRIPLCPTRGDVKDYLERRLDGDTNPDAMDDKLRADIMRFIPEKFSEIFLLVSLSIGAILGEITLYQRRKKLNEMTKGEGLGEAYTATLSRVKAQQGSRSELGMDVLMWVSHSERPLRVDELCHALGVEEGSTDLNIRNVPTIETLLACSLGLVTVEQSSSTVRLIHYTLQEYLSHNPSLFHKPHSMIAEVCLTYLNFRHIRGFPSTLRSVPTTPFFEYASCYWGIHARRGTTKCVKMLALTLLDGYDKHISSKVLLLHGMGFRDRRFDRGGIRKGFTGLHAAAYFGCVEITVALLEANEWDAQETDFYGNTAIAWAARMGHEEVARILLEQGYVSPNTADTFYGRTPLSWAAGNGHEGVVRILLERNDVNPNTAGTIDGQTPLLWAAENGHDGVVWMLLERDGVNPNIADTIYGRTLLSWAAEKGHEGIVRRLLERNDVNLNTADTIYGRTPLSWAAEKGYKGIVRILLERNDVNPNTADTNYGRTPLLWAAGGGHEGIVRILLERNDIIPDTADTGYGRTPLSRAAEKGHEGIVRRLLERNDVNLNTADTIHGRTPLSWAAETGHEGTVRVLLERNDVNPNTAGTIDGRTPLLWAAENGHEEVVRMLLERDDVDTNTVNTICGRTPLSHAAEKGHEGIVRRLLERNDVDPDTADTISGRTPLSRAAEKGHEGIVRILLERTDVSLSTADTQYSQAPLHSAVRNRNKQAAKPPMLERTNLIPGYATCLKSTEPPSPKPSELSEPPSKRTRRSRYPRAKPDTSPSTR